MSNETLARWGATRRMTAVCVLASSLSGCLSEVSTSVRETPGIPVQHLRLIRPETLPIAGTFHQDGHAIVGQLTLPNACNAESRQRVKRQGVTERHTNHAAAIGWMVAGGVLTAVGVGVMAASANADQQVNCGEGRAGDRCESEASAMQELGLTTLLTGLTAATTGGVFLALEPHVETQDLPEREVSKVTSENVACAPTSTLADVVVAIELPGNGTWTGQASADGAVRIDVQPTIAMPDGAKVQIVLHSVPPTFAINVRPGTVLGEVTFEKTQPLPAVPTRKLSKY